MAVIDDAVCRSGIVMGRIPIKECNHFPYENFGDPKKSAILGPKKGDNVYYSDEGGKKAAQTIDPKNKQGGNVNVHG